MAGAAPTTFVDINRQLNEAIGQELRGLDTQSDPNIDKVCMESLVLRIKRPEAIVTIESKRKRK